MKNMRTVGCIIGVSAVIIFGIGLIPVFYPEAQTRAGLFYSVLFFVVLLAASVTLLLSIVPNLSSSSQQRDYRVVHFTLRLALVFGVGAVIVAVLLTVALLALKPLFQLPT